VRGRLEVEQRGRSLASVTMAGPLRSNGEGRLDSFDWRVRLEAGRRALAARVVSTGDNVFVRYGGVMYEVGSGGSPG
jgi:hypothetical protein